MKQLAASYPEPLAQSSLALAPFTPDACALWCALHVKHLKLSAQFSAKGRQTACIWKPSSASWHTKVPAVLIGKRQSYSSFLKKISFKTFQVGDKPVQEASGQKRPLCAPLQTQVLSTWAQEGRQKIPKAHSWPLF